MTQEIAPPLLSVRRLTKRYAMHHLGEVVETVHEVSFDVAAGEFLLLSGPNGAGKSTLLRALYRSARAQGGAALYRSRRGPVDLLRAADVDIAWLRREEIGFVTQFLDVRPRVSAETIVAEPLVQAGAAEASALAEARRWLDALELRRPLWAAAPSSFSGGERQKVNIARALIRPPRLLLLDEPTASLDFSARAAVSAALARLKRSESVAMIAVLHSLETEAPLIDRALELSLGRPGGQERRHVA